MKRARFAVLAALLALLGLAPSPAGATVPPAGTTAAAAPVSLTTPTGAEPAPGSYRAVSPERLVDTRLTGRRLSPGGSLPVEVLGAHGVPATGVGAVQLNVTSTGASRSSHLTVYPSGVSRPTTSSLNDVPGVPVANTVTVRPGADGRVVVANAGGAVDVVVDLVGWWVDAPTGAPGLHSIVPVRVYDSRVAGRAVTPTPTTVTVVGRTVPRSARAVVANLTTVGARATGLPLLSWAAGSRRPGTSNGNTIRGQAVATQVVVGVGDLGRISLAVGSLSSHVVVDVVGYLDGPGATDGRVASLAPVRLLDTRVTGSPLAHNQRIVQPVAGKGGAPADASAALVTITSVPGPTAGGYLTAFAHGEPKPGTSDVNARKDAPVARQVVVALGVDGALWLARTGGVGHVVVDLVGYVSAVPKPRVEPPSPVVLRSGLPGTARGDAAAGLLGNAVRYGLGPWWQKTAPALLARPMDAAAQQDRTDAVRRLSMEALAVSTALATGTYDPADAGMSRADARDVVGTVVDTVACRHRATVVGGWGRTWQSPLWSSLAARAAWLSWDDLSEGSRTCVRDMVLMEADFSATQTPRYLTDPLGRTLRPGNTGAEENSWTALAPAVALAMVPTAEQRDEWRSAQVRLLAASWVQQQHLAANPVVDGVRLRDLVDGVNVEADGSVLNHDRIAPDYSTNLYQNVDALLLAGLSGRQAPQASMLGLGEVYEALSANVYDVSFGFSDPGGTVYRAPEDSLLVYYPQGCDWGTGQALPYALVDVQAEVFGFGGGVGMVADATRAADRHLARAAAMQERSTDGRSYVDRVEYTYVGREEHTAQLAAQLVLSLVIQESGVAGDLVEPQRLAPVEAEQLEPAPAPVDERLVMEK
ncbi:hypothetical protein JQN72_15470 [Phycicoccus sp. CSK15P-2]|uniref:hypothetical protein n=1 Tax=Phycicoccus sp. CSK15P-2 TaxID=2807627 RepID=UPI00194FAFD2|nr:hypothetical protein [Phycicoccus sp. CSK15P-2]MBM6405641.1 hypothetical protein [Phycicoccus sp. CSK15P-2]